MKLKTLLFAILSFCLVATLSAQNKAENPYHATPDTYKYRVKSYEMYGKHVDSIKYDKFGYVTELNTYDMESGTITYITRHFYEKEYLRQIDHYQKPAFEGKEKLVGMREFFTRDDQGYKISYERHMIDEQEKDLLPYSREIYEYNDKKQLIRIRCRHFSLPNSWSDSRTIDYVYNENGTVKMITINKPDGQTLIESKEHFYDEKGRLVKQLCKYANDTGNVTDEEEVIYKYDEHGNIVHFGSKDFPFTFGYDLNMKRAETFLFGGVHVSHLPIIYCQNAINRVGERDKVTYEKNTAMSSSFIIGGIQNDLQVKIVPGEWSIATEHLIGKAIHVFDMNGELLHTEPISASETRITTERFSQGTTCLLVIEEHVAKAQVR